jgi:hypothetical protein
VGGSGSVSGRLLLDPDPNPKLKIDTLIIFFALESIMSTVHKSKY